MKTIGVNDFISIEAKIHGIVHKMDIKKNQYKPFKLQETVVRDSNLHSSKRSGS